MSEQQTDSDNEIVTVKEDKFQATAIYSVEAETKERAKQMTRKFFRDNYDHSVSREVAERQEHMFGDNDKHYYEVVVSDQSSGSLKGSETYNIDELTNDE